MPGCPSFLECLLGLVAGVSVFLATLHLPGTVAKAGIPLAVDLFF